MESIASDLSQGRGLLPWNVALPNEFGQAWLHLVMHFVFGAMEPSIGYFSSSYNESNKCDALLSKGQEELMTTMVNTPLQDREAVLPLGIVSSIVLKLLRDVTHGQPDVCSTYYEYLQKLEQDVQASPYSRAHQESISFLRQEIECVLKVLNGQLSCIRELHSKVGEGAMTTPPHFPRERELYILRECLSTINGKIDSFSEMAAVASDLGIFVSPFHKPFKTPVYPSPSPHPLTPQPTSPNHNLALLQKALRLMPSDPQQNLRRIESNKDRQEGAILVFTIVTIIFLPLSFVASFFGMNTSDIRALDTPQWLFWACALPLTVIVVALAILIGRNVESIRQFWIHAANQWGPRVLKQEDVLDSDPVPYEAAPLRRSFPAPPQRASTGFASRTDMGDRAHARGYAGGRPGGDGPLSPIPALVPRSPYVDDEDGTSPEVRTLRRPKRVMMVV